MKRVAAVAAVLLIFYSIRSSAAEKTVTFGHFGTVILYSASDHPSRVILFVSGRDGWKPALADTARKLGAKDALVAGIDIRRYLKELETSKQKCLYPAGDFEELSKEIQRVMNFPGYIRPVLIGTSSGATLVYAALVQAPSTTFAGALSVGFCPDLEITKPMCKGYGLESVRKAKGKGYSFLPAKNLEAPWIALQGTVDQLCGATATAEFFKHLPQGDLVQLPKVSQDSWPLLSGTFDRIAGSKEQVAAVNKTVLPTQVKDLPLVEVPAKANTSHSLAVIITGDGGWASIDKSIGDSLSQTGMPVVGFDCLQYFWSRRNPQTASADLQRVVQHYLTAWKKETVILIGYSFGADVLPAMASGFPAELRSKIKLVTLLTPGYTADFEFHLTDWLGGVSHKTDRPLLPDIQKLKGTKILCIYGDDDKDTICRDLKTDQAVVVQVHGGHHYGGDYKALAARILKEAQ